MLTEVDLNPLIETYILPGIKAAVEAEVRKAIDKAAREADREIREQVPKIMSEIGLRITEMVSYERVGRDIRITVHMPEKKE